MATFTHLLRCPKCGCANLQENVEDLTCRNCSQVYAVVNGIPDFVSSLEVAEGQAEIAGYYANEAGKYNISHGSALAGTEYNIRTHYLPLFRKYLQPSAKVLEIGSGTGRFSQVLQMLTPNLICTDFSLPMLLQDPGPQIKICADTQNLPIQDSIFDICVGAATFSYLPHKDVAVRSIKRVLKPGGRVLLIDMNRKSPIFRLSPLAYGSTRKKAHQSWIQESNVTNYRRLFEDGGFRVLETGHFSFIPHVAPTWFVRAVGPFDRLLSRSPLTRGSAMRLYIVAEK